MPLKTKTEYDAKVAALIPEDLFKVITDPYYFLTLHWKAQREYLLRMAGTISDSDIAANRSPNFYAELRASRWKNTRRR